MARHIRLVVPGIAMHLVQRGNNRSDCFRLDVDRLVYLALLRDLSALRQCAIHAYCLMTNHVHLLITPNTEDGPSLMMRELGRCYSSYFNRHQNRTGTLWEGRFRSCLVDSAQYVLACYRYIELNPVRARLVASPGDYPWSSHRGNRGLGADSLLTPNAEYAALASSAYAALFGGGDDADFLRMIRESTSGGYPVVGDSLRAELALRGVRVDRGKPGPRTRDGVPPPGVREPDRTITYLTPN